MAAAFVIVANTKGDRIVRAAVEKEQMRWAVPSPVTHDGRQLMKEEDLENVVPYHSPDL